MNLSIISDDCWGVGVYHKLGIKYNSPFIGLVIEVEDYLRLCSDFDMYMNIEPQIFNDYSIILDDVHIKFGHRKPGQKIGDLVDNYKRRVDRISSNKLFKIGELYQESGRYRFTPEDFISHLTKFYKLPIEHKISFTRIKYNFENNFIIKPEHREDAFKLGQNYEKYFTNTLDWII